MCAFRDGNAWYEFFVVECGTSVIVRGSALRIESSIHGRHRSLTGWFAVGIPYLRTNLRGEVAMLPVAAENEVQIGGIDEQWHF